jgi:hypothetical protein
MTTRKNSTTETQVKNVLVPILQAIGRQAVNKPTFLQNFTS